MTENPHYVTPEEAATKFCPMFFNTPAISVYHYEKCLASQCMWWRWEWHFEDNDEGETKHVYSTTHGYCGNVEP